MPSERRAGHATPDNGAVPQVAGLTRRDFVKVLGAGLLITVSPLAAAAQRGKGGRGGGEGRGGGNVSARVHIGKDGAITVMTGKVEGGQGARAELTQAAAEELRVPAGRIMLIMGDTALVPDDGVTAGSRTTPSTVPAVRQGAAAAREMLAQLAGKKWSVDRAAVDVRDGKVIDPAGKRELSYADFAAAEDLPKAFAQAAPPGVTVTPVKQWKVLGTSVPRPNRRDLVTGAHRFPSDIARPGMLYGKVLRAPSYGAKLTAVDLGPAKAIRGVVTFQDGPFVGVAAPTLFAAEKALDAIAKTAKWEPAPHPSSKEVFDYLRQHARGGVSKNPFADEVAKAAKALKKTYHVAYFRPAAVIDIEASLDANGTLTSWHFVNINSGGAAVDTPYKAGKAKSQFVSSDSPMRQSSYRALAATANNFARECFMDELAAAAGKDPLEFRLAHLDNPRIRAVLEDAAKRFNWAERVKKKAPGVGVGLACGTEKGSVVAACAEIAVSQGRISVKRVCEVFECGAVLNPENLTAQVQGCIIMGMGPALREEMQFEKGRVLNASYGGYLVPRVEDVPELDVHLLDRPDQTSAGGGETPIIAIAPAIANAVFHATGQRVREMPIRLARAT